MASSMASSMPTPSPTTRPSSPTNLFSLARSKLQLSLSSKDNYSLHRWVLLKNSITHSNPPLTAVTTATATATATANTATDASASASATAAAAPLNRIYPPDDEEEEEEEADSFMFPDAGKLGNNKEEAEAAWLDSLLETLGEDVDEDLAVVDVPARSSPPPPPSSTLPVDEDEDQLLSPLMSPLVSPASSSDDLVSGAYCRPAPMSVPYPVVVPYPPIFHHVHVHHSPAPIIHHHHHHHHSYELDSVYSPLDSGPLPYENPVPYHDIDDDLEDLSVPDAIEDTSDDESDATTTPSVIQSSPRSSSVFEPPARPTESRERPGRGRPPPHVYINTDTESFRYPFELDPLPFSGYYPDSCHAIYDEC